MYKGAAFWSRNIWEPFLQLEHLKYFILKKKGRAEKMGINLVWTIFLLFKFCLNIKWAIMCYDAQILKSNSNWDFKITFMSFKMTMVTIYLETPCFVFSKACNEVLKL